MDDEAKRPKTVQGPALITAWAANFTNSNLAAAVLVPQQLPDGLLVAGADDPKDYGHVAARFQMLDPDASPEARNGAVILTEVQTAVFARRGLGSGQAGGTKEPVPKLDPKVKLLPPANAPDPSVIPLWAGKMITDITRAEWISGHRAFLQTWDQPLGLWVFAIIFMESECNTTNGSKGYNPGNVTAGAHWPQAATYRKGKLKFRAYDMVVGRPGLAPDRGTMVKALLDVARFAKLVEAGEKGLIAPDFVGQGANDLAAFMAANHYYMEADGTPAGAKLIATYAGGLARGARGYAGEKV